MRLIKDQNPNQVDPTQNVGLEYQTKMTHSDWMMVAVMTLLMTSQLMTSL